MKRERSGYGNVIALGLVSLFNDISTEMILGVLPIFIIKYLNATKAVLGFIEGISDFINYLFRLISGIVSDKVLKRKPIVFIGYFISSLSKPFFAFAHTWIDALIVRATDRIGKGIRTSPRDAIISQSVKLKEEGKAFGIHRTLDQTGAIIGPFLAFLLLPLIGFRLTFLLSLLPASVALIILALFVGEVKVKKRERSFIKGVKDMLHGKFLLLIIALGIFNLGAYNFSFVLVRANEIGISAGLIPIMYMLINITHTAIGYPSGSLSDKIGKEKMLIIGIGVFCLTSIASMLLTNPLAPAIISMLFGIYQGIFETVSRAIVPVYAPRKLRSTAFGVYYISTGLAFLLGITIVGYLWDAYGSFVAFGYSMITAIISIFLLSLMSKINFRGVQLT